MKRLFLASAMIVVAAGCSSGQPKQTTQNYATDQQASFIGPRGADGSAGARGAQGATGEQGAPGYAVAGQRGEAGATGATGERGARGGRGPAGDLAVGPSGVDGPTGATGAEGAMGQTGARGASAEGYAGAAGPTGQRGTAGPAGQTGAKGSTLVGPAGPAGRRGSTGERGEAGQTGARGSTTAGVAGEAGVTGATGSQGEVGPSGPQGPAGILSQWTSYREYWFDANQAVIHEADAHKAAEITAYMKQNPSLELGLDASTNPRATKQRDIEMRGRRIQAIRDALMDAGMPASRITHGNLGDVELRRDGRVEVLIRTNQTNQRSASN